MEYCSTLFKACQAKYPGPEAQSSPLPLTAFNPAQLVITPRNELRFTNGLRQSIPWAFLIQERPSNIRSEARIISVRNSPPPKTQFRNPSPFPEFSNYDCVLENCGSIHPLELCVRPVPLYHKNSWNSNAPQNYF